MQTIDPGRDALPPEIPEILLTRAMLKALPIMALWHFNRAVLYLGNDVPPADCGGLSNLAIDLSIAIERIMVARPPATLADLAAQIDVVLHPDLEWPAGEATLKACALKLLPNPATLKRNEADA